MYDQSLKPIPTVYRNYLFRSRLEARWAVFFDGLGVRWEYEPQGFMGRGMAYLPDFWLPEIQTWAEVKPVDPTDEEQEKLARLVTETNGVGVILIGTPNDGSKSCPAPGGHCGFARETAGDGGFFSWSAVEWRHCPKCLKFRLGFGDTERIVLDQVGQPMRFCGCDKESQIHRQSDYGYERIAKAEAAARRERFNEDLSR